VETALEQDYICRPGLFSCCCGRFYPVGDAKRRAAGTGEDGNEERGVAPREPTGIGGTILGSDTTAPPQASSVTGEVRATGGASAQTVRAKRRQAAGTGTAAGQDVRATRETPTRRAAEEPDPDKVIDWLLKKRSEKR